MINRPKALVLAVFAAYWVTVVVLLLAARNLFDQGMKQLGPRLLLMTNGNLGLADFIAIAVLTALFAILSTGVIRGWRWTFWLIVVAFLANGVRVPFVAFQLLGRAAGQDPLLFVLLQLVVGVIQFLIAVGMLIGYRKGGQWAAF